MAVGISNKWSVIHCVYRVMLLHILISVVFLVVRTKFQWLEKHALQISLHTHEQIFFYWSCKHHGQFNPFIVYSAQALIMKTYFNYLEKMSFSYIKIQNSKITFIFGVSFYNQLQILIKNYFLTHVSGDDFLQIDTEVYCK